MKTSHLEPESNPHLTTHHASTADTDPAEAEISPTLPISTQAERAGKMSCQVYVKPSCPFSSAAVAFLCTYGMSFTVTNVEHYPTEKTRVSGHLGEQKFETPTLLLHDEWLVAPTPSDLKQRLMTLGINPQPKPAEAEKAT